jgi:hypothetical protein
MARRGVRRRPYGRPAVAHTSTCFARAYGITSRAAMKRLVEASGLGLWLWASQAGAQTSGSFHLDYEAPAHCPTAAAFAAKIEGHTPLARQVPGADASRRFRAVFDTSQPAARGRLEIVDFDGTPSVREVEGRDCTEVADALALIAAIVIDPNAQPASPSTETNDAAAAAAASAAAAAAGTRPRPVTEVRMPQLIPAPQLVPRPKPEPEPLPLRLGLIFQAGAVTEQLAPELGLALVYGVEALLDRDELLAPALRVSLYRIRSGEITTAFGKARFEWTAGRISGCPVFWSWENLGFRPCIIADFGSLVAEGYETIDGAKESVLWAALGAAGRAEAVFLEDTLVLEIEAGALVPLGSQRFYFDPSLEVYQIGPGIYALGGIGFRFL